MPGFLHNLSFDRFFNHILATFSAHAQKQPYDYFRCKIRPQNWLLHVRFTVWREILEIGPRFQVFLANILLRMRRNGHKTTSGQIFNPKFETPMGCFLFDYEFWWRLLQDLCVFCAKNGFVMQNFRNLGASGGGCDPFWRNPQKAHLAWFQAFWAIKRANRFRGFSSRRAHEKRDTTKSHRDVIFNLFAGNSPLNQI